MLSYLKWPFSGPSKEDEERSDDDDDDGDGRGGRRQNGNPEPNPNQPHSSRRTKPVSLISKEFNPEAGSSSAATNGLKAEEAEEEEVERYVGMGKITKMESSMSTGIICNTYVFSYALLGRDLAKFSVGRQVTFKASRPASNPQWMVTSMELYEVKVPVPQREPKRSAMKVVRVKAVGAENISVEWNSDKFQDIPLSFIRLPYKVMDGDWLDVQFQETVDDERAKAEDLSFYETLGTIVSIQPNQEKRIVGKMTTCDGELCINNDIYVTYSAFPQGKRPSNGSLVNCVAVNSTQKTGGGREFSWRAVSVTLSKFNHNGGLDAHNRDEEGWLLEDETPALNYEEMYADRGGIRIKPPKYLKFPATKIGCTISKSITIQNISTRPIVFRSLTFPNDSSVCKFSLEVRQGKDDDCIRILDPDESFNFQVNCTPLQMGRTKEFAVFDFDDNFTFIRDFIVTGLTTEEEILNKIRKPEDDFYRPNYRKMKSPEEIEKVFEDNRRPKIRGSAPIRAPFFQENRMPPYVTPEIIREAFKSKNENLLMEYSKEALMNLNIDNYKVRLSMALWFEEIENDHRRRQYDLRRVRLKRGNEPTAFTFTAPHIQEITPPVLVGDPIEVLDPDAPPTDKKYQAFIRKINGTEVFAAGFNEAFGASYAGVPMTIRFCLGRMQYKRQHYAVELAVQRLGKDFLFPFGTQDIEIKEPRIPFIEVEENEKNDTETHETNGVGGDEGEEKEEKAEEEDIDLTELRGVFQKTLAIRDSMGIAPTPGQKGEMANSAGRRVQSLFRFKSDCHVPNFLTSVKLTWFNKSLNEEQRNAVRRILRGQARPLPYILFGPPGTGKTVTVVEAIMQINKLDRNSRVLVAAPSNHAADVIAEYLVKSGQYHPGEFVRFNGFIRHEQGMIEAIKEYCVDGEFLDAVARHRLIISTCCTAGQFLSMIPKPGHFTHVVIDEAGYCTEPESLICAVNVSVQNGGQLILAGDPCQLGPVLMSDLAQFFQLKLSLLERLTLGRTGDLNVYSHHKDKFEDNCGYNPLVLTKLVRNYRAHETLLKLPSRLFYQDDLIACASNEEAYTLTQDSRIVETILRSRGVPLVFHGVAGNSIREKDSASWYNAAEVMQVVDYVCKLKACGIQNEDIAIITPYRKQAEKLRIALQFGLMADEIPKVGSIEEFQGGERQVVIVSTVRSFREDRIDNSRIVNKCGFIFHEKRFNVAITRAKSLMIVVGDPIILARDKHWKEFLIYCRELKAITGCSLPPELDDVANDLMKKIKDEEENCKIPTLAPDIRTSNYNPDGLDEDDFFDQEA